MHLNNIDRLACCLIFLTGQVPQGAVQGGYQDGAPIYIARGKNPAGEPTPGKLHPPYGFFLSWGGKEHHRQEYEVLVCDGISDAPYAGYFTRSVILNPNSFGFMILWRAYPIYPKIQI